MPNPLLREPVVKRSHRWIDARNLAMARLVARKIRRQPELFQEAVATLRHWKQIKPVPKAVLEWIRIFEMNPMGKILATFTASGEEGNRLRQSDPFCGILTHRERIRFLRQYEER